MTVISVYFLDLSIRWILYLSPSMSYCVCLFLVYFYVVCVVQSESRHPGSSREYMSTRTCIIRCYHLSTTPSAVQTYSGGNSHRGWHTDRPVAAETTPHRCVFTRVRIPCIWERLYLNILRIGTISWLLKNNIWLCIKTASRGGGASQTTHRLSITKTIWMWGGVNLRRKWWALRWYVRVWVIASLFYHFVSINYVTLTSYFPMLFKKHMLTDPIDFWNNHLPKPE